MKRPSPTRRITLESILEKHANSANTPQPALTKLTKAPSSIQTGSTAWGTRTLYTPDLEPVVTRLERTPTGPRLVLESEGFSASLPLDAWLAELLAAKIRKTVRA